MQNDDTEPADIGPSHPFLRRREMWLRELMLYSPKYPAMAREVGVYLAMRMSEKRPYTWPSQARIASDLGRKRETVNAALMYLRRDGHVKVTTAKLGDDAGKDPRQFTYELRLPYDPPTDDMSAKRDIRTSAKRDTI
jgi:hypothetical protein